MPDALPPIAAVVLARDRPAPTRATIDALLAQEPAPDLLVLVANEATPEVQELLEHAASGRPQVEIVRLGRNLGCAGGFEAGLAHGLARHEIELVCGFDDDATPLPGCLNALSHAASSLDRVAAVAAVAHDADGTLAWPMHVWGETRPVTTVDEVHALARRRPTLPVMNTGWQALMFPVEVLRHHGNVWGELFLQYEDIELGMRLRRAGLSWYLVPEAECLHPAPPPSRKISLFGRQIEVTSQSGAKEYLTLRNGLAVRSRYDGLRFWYGTLWFVLIRGLLSSLALDAPRLTALRHVLLRGVADAVRGRLGPPPPATAALRPQPPGGRR